MLGYYFDSFWFTVFGMVLSGISSGSNLLPIKVSEEWFPVRYQLVTCSFLQVANPLAILILMNCAAYIQSLDIFFYLNLGSTLLIVMATIILLAYPEMERERSHSFALKNFTFLMTDKHFLMVLFYLMILRAEFGELAEMLVELNLWLPVLLNLPN